MIKKISEEQFRDTWKKERAGVLRAVELLLVKVNELVDAHNERQFPKGVES